MRKLTLISILVVMSVLAAACAPAATQAPAATEAPAPTAAAPVAPVTVIEVTVPGYGETLKAVQARGKIVCGVNAQVPGFGFVDSAGVFSGFDVDFCRALAAAVFGDPEKVEYRALTSSERFTALQAGEIDLLSRNTTWTLTRDTELTGNFVHTMFYDGQGMMVPVDSGLTTLKDLEGGTVCVQTGTTTELNLADVMASEGISYTPAVFEDSNATLAAYGEGRCDAITTDKSGLVSNRASLADPAAHVIMDVTMSKEPLGPMVRHGDDQWFDIVQWTVFALFTAEEFDITSANVDDVKASATNPSILRLLGTEPGMGTKLGLSDDWAYNIIKLVGNYEEIYNHNLGPDTPTFIPRGLNSLYLDGGLLYAPPVR
ncbi:MAG: amino acid ABC transporter substrate-binding protein [Anaerolineales bacterium]|nr:amino acid ABC transporter substrate-binding protein [Anaerolineales bacterium]